MDQSLLLANAADPATDPADDLPPPVRGRWLRPFKTDRKAQFGIIVLLLLVFCAFFGPYLTPYDPVEPSFDLTMSPPSLAHPLGIDDLGRALLSRLIAGARVSLIVGLSTVEATARSPTPMGNADRPRRRATGLSRSRTRNGHRT